MLNKFFSLFIVLLLTINSYCLADFPMMYDFNDALALSESTKQPLIVIFGAKWCPYCEDLKNDIDNGNLSKELDHKIVCYIDIDKHKDLKKEYRIQNLPDTRYLVSKKEVSQLIGYGKTKFKEWIRNADKK